MEPTFACGEYTFALRGDPRIVDLVSQLFHDLRDGVSPDCHTWRFDDVEGMVELTIDGYTVLRAVPRGDVGARVTSTLTRQVLDAEPERLHLHAAAVVDGGRALLVAGPSGSGKSTLCTSLLQAGTSYLTDEMVAIDGDELKATAFPKPISIKRFGRGPVDIPRTQHPEVTHRATEIVASSIGSLAEDSHYSIGTIVLYRFEPGHAASLDPVHRATVIRELLSDSQDAERAGSTAMVALAQLVSQTNCLRMITGDAASSSTMSLLEAHRRDLAPGVLVEVRAADQAGKGPRRSTDVRSVVLDGRVLAFDERQQRVVELDESLALWWVLFDGTSLEANVEQYMDVFGTDFADTHSRSVEASRTLIALGLVDSFDGRARSRDRSARATS